MPLYPLYALLFTDTGLSAAEISTLFILWSSVSIAAEVPSGALADRFSRRGAVMAAGVLQAAGYLLWVALPGYPAFAAGFVAWGLGGALASGAFEALLYDGLEAVGAESHYARLEGRVAAAGLVAQLPAAAAATLLFSRGSYLLVGWVSIGSCLAAAALASRLPEDRREPAADTTGYVATLRAGFAQAIARPAVRSAVIALALLGGFDGFEEYFPLLAQDWGVPTQAIPLALLSVPLAGAGGAALAGAFTDRLGPIALPALLGAAFAVLGVAGVVATPAGLAGIALFYGLYQLVLVVADARLQHGIDSPARATVTSVAGLGIELAAVVLFSAFALGGLVAVVALGVLVTATLSRLDHRRSTTSWP